MGVAEELGLAGGPQAGVLAEVVVAWPAWAAEDPRLRGPSGWLDVPDWLSIVEPAVGDVVFRGLAERSAVDGGDCRLAASALAWLLLPGARMVADRLAYWSPDVDRLVAGQLWIEVRMFAWRRLGRVVGNVLANVREGVMRDLGRGRTTVRADRTWAATVPVDPSRPLLCEALDPPRDRSADAELAAVLCWAVASAVLDAGEVMMLLALAAASDRRHAASLRGQAGLMGNAVSAEVAAALGVSPRTVRRRAARALAALSAACTSGDRSWEWAA